MGVSDEVQDAPGHGLSTQLNKMSQSRAWRKPSSSAMLYSNGSTTKLLAVALFGSASAIATAFESPHPSC